MSSSISVVAGGVVCETLGKQIWYHTAIAKIGQSSSTNNRRKCAGPAGLHGQNSLMQNILCCPTWLCNIIAVLEVFMEPTES